MDFWNYFAPVSVIADMNFIANWFTFFFTPSTLPWSSNRFVKSPFLGSSPYSGHCGLSVALLNMAKGTTDPRVECSNQSNFFSSYYEVLHNSWSNFSFRILTKLNFKISSKHQHQNLDISSALKSLLNLNFKILTKPCYQNLNKQDPVSTMQKTGLANCYIIIGLYQCPD